MDKRIGTFLAIAALGGAIGFAVETKTTRAEAERTQIQQSPIKQRQKPTLLRKQSPSWNGMEMPLPPLSTLELKNLPPDALPLEFNGGTVYWIPLDSKTSAKSKTRARKAG